MRELTKHQQQGVSLRAFSEQSGIREGQLRYYAKKGQILGARKHPLTKKWWIYPPAKLLLGAAAYSPCSQASNEAVQDVRRPRPPSGLKGASPLTADGVSPGVLPAVFAAPAVQETMRSIQKAAGETHYPLVISGSQMHLVERAISLAIDDVIEAMSDEPHGRDEIKPDLDAYNQIYSVLRAAKAAHKNPNDNWRGMEL